MDIRRVVTGHDASGKSVFVSDETVAPVMPARLALFIVGASHAAVPGSYPDTDGVHPGRRSDGHRIDHGRRHRHRCWRNDGRRPLHLRRPRLHHRGVWVPLAFLVGGTVFSVYS